MRKAFIVLSVLVLVSLSGAARADDWLLLRTTTEGDRMFLRKGSVRQVGIFRRAYTLMDWKDKTEYGSLSSVSFSEYDCTGKRYRVLQVSAYTGARGTGAYQGSTKKTGGWVYPTPNTIGDFEMQVVCAVDAIK